MVVKDLAVVLILLSMLISECEGQVVRFRSCKRAPVKSNFNLPQYLGTWYEVRRYFPIFFEQNLMCTTATYTQNPDGTIRVVNRAVNRFSKEIDTIVGSASVVSNAKLNVNFGTADQTFGVTPEGNYWVLETDYTTYAVVYSCTEFFATIALEIVWILGRNPTLPELTLRNIYSNLRAQGIDTEPLKARMDIQGSVALDCKNYYEQRLLVG